MSAYSSRYRISIVNYTNTLPFKFGINRSALIDKIDLSYDVPSVCAQKLLNDEVDIGLIPVAVLPLLKENYIISNYCLGSNEKVDTVKLYSRVPLDKITDVRLDHQSRTSVTLVQVLAKFYWKIEPDFVNAQEVPIAIGIEKLIDGTTAAVVIGDRCFDMNGKFEFEYDLAAEWYKFTATPFVFAVWASNKKIKPEFIAEFEKALKYGVDHIQQAVEENIAVEKREMINTYLTKRISYNLDEEKKKGMAHFLDLLKQL